VTLEALGGGLQMFFELQRREAMCEDSTAFEFLNVHLLAYLPIAHVMG
jgi:hypothetical protein